MLNEHEKQSLRMILDRVTPDKVTGIVEILLECYSKQYSDVFSKEIVNILENTVESMKRAEKTTSINAI